MKKIILTILLPFVLLVGCDNNTDKEKRRCLKDPTAPGCPHSSDNIITTPPKHWGIDDLRAPMKKFQEDQLT